MTATPENSSGWSDCDDSALLHAIAQQRDRAAFAELYQRYEQPAHSLALHLTGNAPLAEDSLQNAMLRVWTSAGTYRVGNARAWVLRIVARESLRTMRGRQRNSKEKESVLPEAVEQTPREELEHRETLSAVTRVLEKLPQLERQLIALSYAAGLTQDEIASELSMSQRTVSYKITEALKRLKGELTKAGFAAALPLIATEQLGDAMLKGYPCAPGLAARISNGIDGVGNHAVRNLSRRAAVARHGTWLPLAVGAVVVCAAGAGAALWRSNRGATPVQPSTRETVRTESPDKTPEAAPFVRVERAWNFNSVAQTSDFKADRGTWHFVPDGGPDKSGCMEVDTDLFSTLIDFHAPLPCLVTFDAQSIPPERKDHYLAFAGWSSVAEIGIFHNTGTMFVHNPGDWGAVKVFVTSRSVDMWTAGKRTNVLFLRPNPDAQMELLVRGRQRIDNLKIQSIRAEDVPDVSEFIDAAEKIAPEKRSGTIALPGLKSTAPGQPVTIEFLEKAQDEHGKP